jgi:hypothetical protein
MRREIPQMVECIHDELRDEASPGTTNSAQPKPMHINPSSISFQQATKIMEAST